MCGGANHGRGLMVAAQNTLEMFEGWLDRFESEHGCSESTDRVRKSIAAERAQCSLDLAEGR
jgi:hypothetical protein